MPGRRLGFMNRICHGHPTVKIDIFNNGIEYKNFIRYGEDTYFLTNLLDKNKRIDYINKPLTFYISSDIQERAEKSQLFGEQNKHTPKFVLINAKLTYDNKVYFPGICDYQGSLFFNKREDTYFSHLLREKQLPIYKINNYKFKYIPIKSGGTKSPNPFKILKIVNDLKKNFKYKEFNYSKQISIQLLAHSQLSELKDKCKKLPKEIKENTDINECILFDDLQIYSDNVQKKNEIGKTYRIHIYHNDKLDDITKRILNYDDDNLKKLCKKLKLKINWINKDNNKKELCNSIIN